MASLAPHVVDLTRKNKFHRSSPQSRTLPPLLLQVVDGAMEVEVLMKRMVELQQQEEECTQEEMVTRFERERSESIPTGTDCGQQTDRLHVRLLHFIYFSK